VRQVGHLLKLHQDARSAKHHNNNGKEDHIYSTNKLYIIWQVADYW